ncbi:MAG: Flp family type IVb pilin [Oceanococcaceae bacterium]
MMTTLKSAWMGLPTRQQRGAGAIEYALIAGLIAVILIAAFGVLGTEFNGFFEGILDTTTE